MQTDFISIDDATRVATLICRTGIAITESGIHKYFYDARAEDVKRIIKARWNWDKEKDEYCCSNCRARVKGFGPNYHYYCYNCGAVMEGVYIDIYEYN